MPAEQAPPAPSRLYRAVISQALLLCAGTLLLLGILGATHDLAGVSIAPTTNPVNSPAPRTKPAATLGRASDARPASPASGVRDSRDGELLHEAVPSDTSSAMLASSVAASGRPRVLRMEVTAYCACDKCCGPEARGITASGLHVSHNNGAFVAADTGLLPFGTLLSIPGYHDGEPVEVVDRGGAIKGYRLDVYFHSHRDALKWGRQWLNVTVVE